MGTWVALVFVNDPVRNETNTIRISQMFISLQRYSPDSLLLAKDTWSIAKHQKNRQDVFLF